MKTGSRNNADRAVTRHAILSPVRRLVIKVGSGVLTAEDGLNTKVMSDLAAEIMALRRDGKEVILVSSGAIASGLRKVGMSRRPKSISQQQAMAAIGQSSLMRVWENSFAPHGQKVAQILLTRDDLTHRGRYLNARNTIFALLGWKVLPIINENDTVVVDEIKFGDNDNLGAMVTNLTESHLLVNLTDISGLYDKDPRTNKDASLIGLVDEISRDIVKYAGSIPGFLGTGGMASKIRAAEKVSHGGVPTIIANGLRPGILGRIFSGDKEGTLFLPRDIPLRSRKHWIAFTKAPRGVLVIDEGAENAILGNGKSLLPSGVREVQGRFSLGDKVAVVDGSGHELAVGMVNYHSGDIRKIMGLKSHDIEGALGFKHEDEVIHRDNLVVTRELEEEDGVCRLTK
ncbi:MAG: glutamate 5-kinase [Thermodesulfobacteriota bacterium]